MSLDDTVGTPVELSEGELADLKSLADQLPSPHTPLLKRLVSSTWSGIRVAAGWVWGRLRRTPLTLSMWIAGRLVSHPLSAACFVSAVALATPVTFRDVAIVLMILAATLVAYPERRTRLSSLQGLRKYAKRRRKIKRRWVTVCEDGGLAKPGERPKKKRTPKLRRVTQTPVGVRVSADGGRVSIGQPAVASAANKLKAGFRARDLRVREHGGSPSQLLFDLVYDDPFKTLIQYGQLPLPTKPLHVVTGLDQDGDSVEVPVWLPRLIVGGKGAGKSSEVWTTLKAIHTARIFYRVRVFDPKGGQEFVDLEDAAYYYERNPTQWPVFLERAWVALAAQQAALRSQRMRKNDFTIGRPLDVMIIDELLTVLAFSNAKTKIRVKGSTIPVTDAFMIYLSECRSAGFTVLACSQLTQKDVIGSIRDLFDYVTCLRVASDDMVRAILGDPKLYPAHEIPATPATAGIGYTETDRGIIKYRSAYLDDAERAQVAANMRGWSDYYRRQRANRNHTEESEDSE